MKKDFLSDSDPDEYEKKIIFYEELEYEKEERKQRKSKLKINRNEPKP
jgi:tRNA threonylcarbamoyladenosine modification (KEOPS) complex  Pcc1 subunit